MFVREKLKLL